MNELLYKDETYQIIGACLDVYNELGSGFLEEVYQEALEIVFKERKIRYLREQQIKIQFKTHILKKTYRADFICFDHIIVELKALATLTGGHESQLINYLKATQYEIGLLVNFGSSSLQHKRLIYNV